MGRADFGSLKNMRIRLFSENDLQSVLEIQSSVQHAAALRSSDYLRLALDQNGLVLVAELEAEMPPGVVAFAAFRRIDEEAELWNIAVAPGRQRRGIAKALLRDACRKLSEAGARRVFLEVRASNASTLRLYEAAGFVLQSRRKDYYTDPREDAAVLSLELSVNPEGMQKSQPS